MAQNGSDLYFPAARSRRESSDKKLSCGWVFMENMNECSMQLLCLLISPQGWGTLRLYSFTTSDGLLGRVRGASLGGCVWDHTRSCPPRPCPGISGRDSSHMWPLANNMLDTWRESVGVQALGVHPRRGIGHLTGIPMSCHGGSVMKSLPRRSDCVHIKEMLRNRRALGEGACLAWRGVRSICKPTREN